MPWRHLLLVLALVAAGGGVRPALGRDADDRPRANAPRKNFSNIHADTGWVTKAFQAGDAEAQGGRWAAAVRALQEVIDQAGSRESAGDAAPYVRAVNGTAVYEGAWIAARHRIQGWGAEALAAYESEFGGTARTLLQKATARRDRRALAGIAARFLGLRAGRLAALTLIDLHLEAGDRDGAHAWIEALTDLEDVSGETREALAPWRTARIEREAIVVGKDADARTAIVAALTQADGTDGHVINAIPVGLRDRPPPARSWLTTGGNATRAAVPPTLGHRLQLSWFRGPSPGDGLVDTVDPRRRSHNRPSLWLPPRAVATEAHLFVSDGQYLHVLDLHDGSRVIERALGEVPDMRAGGIGEDVSVTRRKRLGLLEGHALTLHPVASFPRATRAGETRDLGPGWLVIAALPDGRHWDWTRQRGAGFQPRNDRLQAWHWNGRDLEPVWRAGGVAAEHKLGGLLYDTRLYGAPIVYAGTLWVAGTRPARATQDRWEAWVFGLDPLTGHARTRTHLGTGTPVRVGRMDEVIPTSPAAARGRVVVGTALGILGAVDARDGRVQWIYRYSRSVETERGRIRNRSRRDEGLRPSSFFNEPPMLALDRVFVTPTDSHELVVTYDRPRTRARALRAQPMPKYADRRALLATSLPEHIAGVVPHRDGQGASLVLVCQGDTGDVPGALVGVYGLLMPSKGGGGLEDMTLRWPLEDEEWPRLWKGISPTGFGAQPYGRALVTETEIFVSQEHGIAVFELHDEAGDGHLLGVLDADDIPKPLREGMEGRPYGNLIPVPGRGLVAVNATSVAFWRRR